MRKIFSYFIFITMCIAAHAQMHSYSTNFTYSLKNFVDTIPIEIADNQIFVTGTVNGHPYRFCIDTGSSQGTIYDNAPFSGLRSLGNVVSQDAAGRSVFNKSLCCKIDTRHQRMILTDRRDFFDGEKGYALHYTLKWWVPYVMVSPFKRHYDEALFDTGSPILYTMNKERFDEHAYKSKNVNSQVAARVKGNMTIGNIGAEHTSEVAFLKLNRLKWDDFSFLNVNAVTTQGTSRIGASLLNYGAVVINGFRRYIRFLPYTEGDSTEVNNKAVTTAYVPTSSGRAAVGVILPESPDYQAGLRQGDIILSIDGHPINTFTEFQQYPLTKGMTHRLIVWSKEGRNKEVIIRR